MASRGSCEKFGELFALFCDPFATTHFSSFTYTNNTPVHTHSVYTCRMQGHSVLYSVSSPCVLCGCHSDYRVSVCPQGEQCNIVPDNVDDIVADIAQEEKEEGLDPAPISLFFLSYTRLKAQLAMLGHYCIFIPFTILQMILLRRVSTPTGLHGPPAARPLVKRASG